MNNCVGGVGLGGVNPGEDSNKVTQPTAKQVRKFDADASVSNQSAWQARSLHAKHKPAELAAINMASLSPAQLLGFQRRVENAIVKQEADMLKAVNTFAGNDQTLRPAVSSMLLSF